VTSCCAYPNYVLNVYGTRGGLKGTRSSLEWRTFKRSEAPRQKLITAPLCKPDGTPAYPHEELQWHLGAWPVAPAAKDTGAAYSPAAAPKQAASATAVFYTMLYKTLTRGAPLEITPEQVRRQIAVIEECRRQNPRIYRRR